MDEIWKSNIELMSPSGSCIGEMTVDWKDGSIHVDFENVDMMRSFLKILEDSGM